MSEFGRYTPQEANQESTSEKPESAGLKQETVRNIQEGLPPYSPEKVEGPHKSPESLPEKEPGTAVKPSFSDDPGAAQNDNQVSDTTQAADDQAGDTQTTGDTPTATQAADDQAGDTQTMGDTPTADAQGDN